MAKKKLSDIDTAALSSYAETFPSSKPSRGAKESEEKEIEKEVTYTLRLSQSLDRQLTIKAATEGKTKREIILRGLQTQGFLISDEELVDRRKNKTNKKK